MTGIYKTATGKTIDMGQLALKNEKVRAVGNMSVNAHGDVIDPNSKPTASRADQVNKSYSKQTRNVPKAPARKPVVTAPQEELVGLDEPAIEEVVEEVKPKAKAKPKAKGGLAGAIEKTKKK